MNSERTYVEYQDGGGLAMFHEVVIEGTRVDVRTGRIGTQGILRTSVFDSADDARQAAAAEIETLQTRYSKASEAHKPQQPEISKPVIPRKESNQSPPAQTPLPPSLAMQVYPPQQPMPPSSFPYRHPALSEPTPYADFGKRTLAWIIDGVVQTAIFIGGLTVLLQTPSNIEMLMGFWFFAVFFGSSVFFESSEWQATLGKRAMGLIVTDTNGERLSFGRSFARMIAKLGVLFGTSGLGFITAAFTERKQTLYDLVTGTLVYSKDEFERLQEYTKHGLALEYSAKRGAHSQLAAVETSSSADKAAEKAILQAAQNHAGILTQAIVAIETHLSLDEAEQALQQLTQRGVCQMELTDSGLVQYHFPAFT